jgi:outer membrane protein TolC
MLVIALALGLSGSSHVEAQSLTLDQAISMATSNSRLARIARAKVSEREAGARGARAELLPRVSVEGTFITSTGTTAIELPRGALGTDGSGAPIPDATRRVEQDGSSLMFGAVTVSQPLTPLFRIIEGSRVARSALDQSEAERVATELDVTLAVEKLYLAVLMAEHRRDAAAEMMTARRAALSDVERAMSAGMTVDARVSEARATALEAEQAVLAASHAVEDRRAELNELLGFPLDTAPPLSMPAATVALGDLTSEIARALSSRPEISATAAQVEQARHAARAARAEYIPDVAVFARESYQDAVAFLPRSSVSAGVQAKWNVLDFGRRSAQVDQRAASLRVAEENLARVRDQVTLEVERAYRNAVRADRMVVVARQAVTARREAERITSGQTAAGFVLVSAVQEASAHRVAAESAALDAELGARLARAELARAVGVRPGATDPR